MTLDLCLSVRSRKVSIICNIGPLFLSPISIFQQLPFVAIKNRKSFWVAKPPCFHTKPSNFSAIFNLSVNLNFTWHFAENWCLGYLRHALSSSECHMAVAKRYEAIGHVANCCKCLIMFCIQLLRFIYSDWESEREWH